MDREEEEGPLKPASAKAKGRRLQNAVASAIRSWFALAPSDVKPAVMGEQGCDIHLSEAAKKRFPFAVECKNTERLDFRGSWAQAMWNAEKQGLPPLLVTARNREETLATLRFTDLLDILAQRET